MTERRPIDIKRESGGMADIGLKSEGAIVDTFEFKGNVIVVKEKAIYNLIFADSIDPERVNIGLPTNMQKRVLGLGSDSELVARTFLTARNLFRKGYLPQTVDYQRALELALEAVQELVAMESECSIYLKYENLAISEYEERRDKNLSYKIPSVIDVNTRCKTFFQKADHVYQFLIEITRLFYPKLKQHAHFSTFHKLLEDEYGTDDSFTQFMDSTMDFLKLTRNVRDCLDHMIDGVIVRDFDLQINSNVLTPTIEVNFRGSKLPRTSLCDFLPRHINGMIDFFENLIAYLCTKFGYQVGHIPVDKRRHRHVQYGYYFPVGDGAFQV